MAKHGRYKIVRKVADGGMAEIFLATQIGREGFQKPVILKRIHSTIYADPQFRNMFIDEAHISMGLSHSNIVQILDLGVGSGRYFLVMEVVDGWDLGRELHRAATAGTPLPRDLGLHITAEVCRALAYAHGKMDANGEQALGKAIDARSDLFALGVVLYQLMTGVRPFEAPTDLEILLRVQKADFRPPHVAAPDLPPHVSAIISRAMQLDPDMRYQSADEMLTDIEQVLRTVFRPVGQTELKRWLAALSARDGQQPMAKGVSAQTPAHGRGTGSTGEMEGKDVELDDVDAEEATSLASIDGPGGEMRPRMTRPRAGADELALPLPDESALSGRMAALEFPLPIPDTEERPGRRRAGRSGGFPWLLFGLVLVGGAAFAGRHYGLLREMQNALGTAAGTASTPTTDKAAAPEPEKPPAAAAEHDAGAAPEGRSRVAAHKPEEAEPAREPEI